MEVEKCIKERRSVRNYIRKPITKGSDDMIFEKGFTPEDNPLRPLGICADCTGSTETDAQLSLDLQDVK